MVVITVKNVAPIIASCPYLFSESRMSSILTSQQGDEAATLTVRNLAEPHLGRRERRLMNSAELQRESGLI